VGRYLVQFSQVSSVQIAVFGGGRWNYKYWKMQVWKIEVQKDKMCKGGKYKYGKIKYGYARMENASMKNSSTSEQGQYYSTYLVLYRLVGRLGFSSKG